jgi:hypothetical protein
MLDAFFI